MTLIYIVLAVAVLLVLWAIFAYNRFVSFVTRMKEAWSDIDVQLKRRYDLIPNLVNTVKGYAAHEKSAFENVTKARAAAMGAQSLSDKNHAENQLTGALKSLFAVAEAYPDLKANQNFLELQRELSDIEEKIAYARQFYNSNVLSYNTKTATFPSVIYAGMLGFKPEEFFEAEEEARQDVKV